MYKLILSIMLAVGCVMLSAQQMDELMAMHALFQAKNAANRAAHAAAQQVDRKRLSLGERWIDEARAEAVARYYLQENLQLDDTLQPLPESFWQSQVEWLVFDVINGDETFPYLYQNDMYRVSEKLERPGVVLIIALEYPRTFSLIEPIRWELKAVAELYVP